VGSILRAAMLCCDRRTNREGPHYFKFDSAPSDRPGQWPGIVASEPDRLAVP